MTKLMYRGVAYDKAAEAPKTLAEQMREPELTYRGVEHGGKRAKAAAHVIGIPNLVYRGARFA